MPAGSQESPASKPDGSPCCKVGRVAARYGFVADLDRFGRAWADPDGASLRDLARRFNRAVVRNALREAGKRPVDGEAANVYALLAGEREASEGAVRRLEDRLERDGVDPATLREDFVSYRTVDRHFKRCESRERDEGTDREDPQAAGLARIRRLRRRLEAVTEGTVTDLAAAGHLDSGEFDVVVDVRAVCGECGTRTPVGTVIEEGCPTCGASR